MADQRLHSLNLISREPYLTASSGSRDLLQHTADILCQSGCTLRVYSHGLAARLILFRHCFAAKKLEKCCRGSVFVFLQDVMRSEPSPRFNDSPSPALLLRIFVQEFTYLTRTSHVNPIRHLSIATVAMHLPLMLCRKSTVPDEIGYWYFPNLKQTHRCRGLLIHISRM